MEPDENGIRLAFLDEVTYRKTLWNHRPLRDFWRVGSGYSKKLEEKGLFTMGDIARCSIGKNTDYYNEDLLYKMFGINAELLIDHAWGYEPCTIKDIKKFKPVNNSISNGQVLQKPYNYEDAKLIIKEMTDELSLELVDRGIITNQLVLDIGYDIVSADSAVSRGNDIKSDRYGRNVPKPAHGSINLKEHTSSGRVIINAMMELYDRIVNKSYYIRRMSVTANHVIFETEYKKQEQYKQLDLFSYMEFEENEKNKKAEEEKDKDMQKAVLKVKKKYGKNSLVKGMSLLENATAMDRNKQIGGHKA
jgi:DNA polymerase V